MHRRCVFYYLTDAGLAELYRAVMRMPGARWAGRGLVFLAVCGVCYVVRQPFSPSDWVDVTVRHVPAGLSQLYLIAEGPDGPRALNGYDAKVFAFTTPANIGGQHWYGDRTADRRIASVQWLLAQRYGALAQRSDGAWELWWFGPGDLEGPSVLRYLTGGGTAAVRLPDESWATPPTPEFLEQVGLPDRSDTP